MFNRVLITGGAGFIGSHLCDQLLLHGYRVRALDNLHPQVHGPRAERPGYLDSRVELMVGDVRDAAAVARALEDVDAVVHLAAAVGVGQSMYCVRDYTEVNNVGTAVLMEQLIAHPVKKLVIASSMSIYGEGRYRDGAGNAHDCVERSFKDLRDGQWEPRGEGGVSLTPVPTAENKQPALASVYALSKYDQERLGLLVGRAYGIPTVALRLFNTYGPRQALSNPYTGVLAIFASRLRNGRAPVVFEDGQQRRDFVSVYDVARAFRLALESERADYSVINVGSGRDVTILEVARRLAGALGRNNIGPDVTQKHRVGDIRHCFADIERARQLLGYSPTITMEQGLAGMTEWLSGSNPSDRTETARRELETRGLTL